jgi:hypothetical protein
MVKKQQMRWSQHGAHMLMQVRTAEMNGELRDRLRANFGCQNLRCLRCSSPNHQYFEPHNPREITGLLDQTTAFLRLTVLCVFTVQTPSRGGLSQSTAIRGPTDQAGRKTAA